MMPRASRAGPHRKTAGLDASAAERYGVRSRKLRQRSLLSKRIQQVLTSEPRGSKNGSGANQKFAAMHKASRSAGSFHDTPAAHKAAKAEVQKAFLTKTPAKQNKNK